MRRLPARLERPAGSLRYRLLALVLVPLVLMTGTVILLAARWSTDYTYRQLLAQVTTDLSVAQDAFTRLQSDALADLDDLATNPALIDALALDDTARLADQMVTAARLSGFDSLVLFDAGGVRRLIGGTWQERALRASTLSRQALQARPASLGSNGAVGIERVGPAGWSGELEPGEVELALVDTPRAAPDARAVAGAIEDRALLIRAIQPIVAADGRRVGMLDASVLLNRNIAFVDAIRDLVYSPGSLAPGSRGTVTLFLDDVRVSTNVRTDQDRRALGTRVSAAVREQVLGRGESWSARSFVVNDWYVSGYEPIVDTGGTRIGMLYAGFSDAPYRADLLRAIGLLAALAIAGSVLAAIAATLGARALFRPVERMALVARASAAGEHRRVGELDAARELRELGALIDAMLDAQDAQRERIEQDSRSLERKVAERTEALEERNARLQESFDLLRQTRARLATAERLAALGELTAGVAHEINNPTAVILGNMDILIAEIGDARDDVSVEIDLIIEQVDRIRSITDRLLVWSRSNVIESTSSALQPMPVAALIDNALALVRHELRARAALLTVAHEAPVAVAIDRDGLQQVLVNLVMNALEACETGRQATLRIVSRQVGREVHVSVADDGKGIEAVDLARVFDPFFTAGKRAGTGLGLSVSHGIVDRAGGRIEVESVPGRGACFTVVLPCVPIATTGVSNMAWRSV